MLMSHDRIQLAEHGGHMDLSRRWAYLFPNPMKLMIRKGTTAKSRRAPEDFAALKKALLDDDVVVTMEE